MSGIVCPECGSTQNVVLDSRPADGRVRRRRKCVRCSGRFTTHETREADDFGVRLQVTQMSESLENLARDLRLFKRRVHLS